MIQGFWFFKNVLIYRVKQGLVFCPFYLFAIVFFLKSLIQPAIFNYNKIYDNFNRKRVYFLRNNNWHYTSEIYTHMILNKATRLRKYLKSWQSWLLFASVTISSMVFWLLAFKSRMEKRGSRYLRYALFNSAKYVCQWDDTFAEYLAKKRSEGKHYYVAISHACKKLIRVIYHLEKTGESYKQ